MIDTIRTMRLWVLATVAILSLAAPMRAAAQVEVEVDPFAYAFNGFSLHLAKVLGSARVNVGTFGLDVPSRYHGNEGWNSTMRGAGVKVDYLGSRVDGFFAGLDGGYMRNRYTLTAGGDSEVRGILGLGVRGGYRQPIGGSGLYLAPWVSLSYNFDGDVVMIAGDEFRRSAVAPFATVHVGWRF